MKYVVVKLHLSERQKTTIEINSGCDIANAYFDASTFGRVDKAIENGMYRPVAVVDTESLSTLFTDANSLEDHWFNNENVSPMVPMMGVTSMSVGDLAIDTNGDVHVCKMMGWEKWDEDQAKIIMDLL